MSKKIVCNTSEEFIQKLKEIFESGVNPKKVKMFLPHPDHHLEEFVEKYIKPSKLKLFTLIGGATGCLTGFAFTIYTVLAWPLITSGKPLISIPAFVVIAFELTILFGALSSLTGFFILGRMPRFQNMIQREEYGNQFVILIDSEDE